MNLRTDEPLNLRFLGGVVSRFRWPVIVAAVLIAAVLTAVLLQRRFAERDIRAEMFAELQPVTLKDCTLKRYGGSSDGGYLLCENLIAGIQSAYSYGIESEDNWGCQLSREFQVHVHQYDCFTEHRPTCDGGRYTFHDECVGAETKAVEGNLFDTIPRQIAQNGDSGKRLIVKIDIEGAEWESLLATPDEVLARIDQIPMEFHGTNDPQYVDVVRKLKRQFHLVNLHFNNYACSADEKPFPARAFQVLWVNKRLAEVDPAAPVPAGLSPANAPDNPDAPDCQLTGAESQ
jgi:hypothetical protein